MKLPAILDYSLNKIESIARSLVKARWSDMGVPVDIDYLLESEPGVVMDTDPQLEARFNVPGATIYHPKEDRFTILIDSRVADGNPGFYRFTVAEELGHVRLHRAALRCLRTIKDAVDLHHSPDYERMDRNAKWFASAVLMPHESLRSDAEIVYSALVKQYGFRRPDHIKQSLVIRLGQRYVVNVSPMEYRLRNWPLKILVDVDYALGAQLKALPALDGDR